VGDHFEADRLADVYVKAMATDASTRLGRVRADRL
jgi:hypothetical protein